MSSQLTRGRAVAARVAHNHKVAGSSPAPATKKRVLSKDRAFFGSGRDRTVLRSRGSTPTKSRAGIYSEHDEVRERSEALPFLDIMVAGSFVTITRRS